MKYKDKFQQEKIATSMKKLFITIVILKSIGGCSSFKSSDQSPIEHFLHVTSTKSDELIITKEKISTNKTIEIFKGTIPFEKDREPFMPTGVSNSLFKNDEFEVMAEKYYNKDVEKEGGWSVDEWTRADFKFPIHTLISKDQVNKMDGTQFSESHEIYAFSNVIRYGSNYYVFSYSQNHTQRQYFSPYIVVVMQKKDKKWIIVEQANREF